MKYFALSQFCDSNTLPQIMTLINFAKILALAMNIFLLSLPRTAVNYNTTASVMSLSIAIYLGANVLVQLFNGPISDHSCRRPVILVSLLLLICDSIATIGRKC